MNLKSFALGLGILLLLASSTRAQNYTITLRDGQNGTGNVILTYAGPMLTPTQNWTQTGGFSFFNPSPLQWTTPPITADLQPGVLNPCNAAIGNGGPNGEAAITCESSNNSNGLPLFSFCFVGAQWPIPVGTYNVDTANQRSCGNYFYAQSQQSGYASYAFLNSASIVVAPAMPEVLYDSNSGSTVAAYSVSPADGTLTPLAGSPFPNGGGQSNYFALHPSKKFLYVANFNALTISAYSIDASGVLNSIAAPVPLNPAPNAGGFYVAMDPLGRYLYAASVWGWPSNVYAWRIDQTNGALTPVTTGMPATAGSYGDSHAFCVTPDPKGRFVYVCNQDDGNVTSFVVNQSTGALTNPQLTQTGLRPRGISIEPSGRFAYVANYGVNPGICQGTYAHGTGTGCVVRAFSIDQSTGVLASIGANDSASTGTNPTWSTIDPLGRTLYTTNITSNDVSAFSLDPNTGALTPIGTYPAGQGPYFVDVTPSGKSVHVANVFEGTTFSYSRDASGALSFTGSTPGTSPNGLVSLQPDGDSDWGLAQVNSGNTFTGNQTVNGTVTATAFVGDGSSLTGIVAQTANTANSASTANYAATAGTAASSSFAASAGDAMTLGGNLPGAFAPASGSTNYVAKGGDTMTGALNLPANGLIAGNNQLVLSGGSVGIGTTSPSAKLHVDNGNALINFGGPISAGDLPERTLMLGLRPDGQDSALGFQVSSTARGSLEYNTGYGGDGSFYFWNWNNNLGWVNPLTVAATGNIGIGTKTPAANLDVNGTANFHGLVTFAAGQTFPGSGGGTITGVTAGAGLSGGGSSGNVTLNLNTGFTDSRYLSLGGGALTGNLSAPSFTGAGVGLTSLNPANLTAGTANINISGNAATATVAGSATNAVSLGGIGAGNFARLDIGNNFNGNQSVTGNLNATGSIQATSATLNGPFSSGLSAALNASGILIPFAGAATSTQGFPSYPLQFWATAFSTNSSVPNPRFNQIFQLVAEPAGNNTPNPSATFNLQFISTDFPPPPAGYTMQETGFSITAQGGVSIGGGATITRHVSALSQAVTFNMKLSPGTCTVWSTSLQAATDGDTVAVGLGSSLMSANVVFSAWASNGSVSVRICNPTGAPTTLGAGNIRIDLWKH